MLDKAEQLTASVRATVEHLLRVIQCQFGFTTARFTGLAKNTAQLIPLCALSNVWMARRHGLGARGCVCVHSGHVPDRGLNRPCETARML